MQHHTTTTRSEAERLLGIAEKLLRDKDFAGCRDFAVLAHETEPLLEGPDQILAVAEVLLAAEKRINNKNDWYSILKVAPQQAQDMEFIKKQYRQLALLLHPDKNRLPLADSAFRFVADAWGVLSDPAKKSLFDGELSRFTRVDLVGGRKPQSQQQRKPRKPAGGNSHQKLPIRRNSKGGVAGGGSGSTNPSENKHASVNPNKSKVSPNFWTPCPYCYNLFEYPRAYEGCCVRCDNGSCKRTFTAAEISSMPPLVPGQEAYYCCWGFFPMGFAAADVAGFQKWMRPPPIFEDVEPAAVDDEVGAPAPSPPRPAPPPPPHINVNTPAGAIPVSSSDAVKRKRGRPRKNI